MADFVGGLISGIDPQLIIDKMVALESRPIVNLQARQAALKVQVSAFGDLLSKLSSLGSASRSFASDGVRAVKVAGSNQAFSATASSAATPGTYSIAVQQLATAARTLSAGFSDPQGKVKAGQLQIEVQGETFDIDIEEGAKLPDVVDAIAASGAPVDVAILSDGRQSYLSITSRKMGHVIDAAPDTALVIRQTLTGTTGTALFAEDPAVPGGTVEYRHSAQNALLTLNGLAVERSSNEIADLLPGVRLSLKATSPQVGGVWTAENLVLSDDRAGTQARLQSFVDSYNAIAGLIRKNISASDTAAGPLAGDGVARGLELDLQGLLSMLVPGGAVETLSEAGVKLERTGLLSIDADAFAAALDRDPAALDRLFKGPDGVDAALQKVIKRYTNSTDGLLIERRSGLEADIGRMDEDIAAKQVHIEKFRNNLMRQFTKLEETLSKLNSTKNYLDQLDKAREKK